MMEAFKDLLRDLFSRTPEIGWDRFQAFDLDPDQLTLALFALISAGEVEFDPDRTVFTHRGLRPIACGECGSEKVARIVYGLVWYPTLEEDLRAGTVTLGGCTVEDNLPLWECRACGYSWGLKPYIPIASQVWD